VPIGLHIACRQREASSGLLRADVRQPLQRLRRGEFGADDPALPGHDLDRDEARPLLEQQPRRRLWRLRRQHESGADIGMAGKRKLPVHGEDAHLRIVRGIARRQHEGRLRIVELGGNRLHLRGRQPAGIEHHGERIAAEGAIGEDIDGDVTALHVEPPVRHGRNIF